MSNLKGTSVVITGGARGLGRAMTLALTGAGANVLVVDIDNAQIGEIYRESGGATKGICADVTTERGINEIVQKCLNVFGHIDVIVNNAGISLSTIRPGDRYANPIRFYELTRADVSRFVDLHMIAPFLLSCAAVNHMLEQGWGRIVTVTTGLDTMTRSGQAPYGPSKAGSEAFTAVIARDLEGSGVTANVLIPGGAADTRFIPLLPDRTREHLVSPSVMGPPIVWLSSKESDGITARRFMANRWDPTLPPSEAAERAGAEIAWTA
ncbi:MAG: SDR family oxidoreductase [Acidimicrobiaceae bacterium]|nr:SDR family oxidoreductase [Acidimicrobiaceae bacterium]